MSGASLLCFIHYSFCFFFLFFFYITKIFSIKVYSFRERFVVNNEIYIFMYYKVIVLFFFLFQFLFLCTLKLGFNFLNFLFFKGFLFVLIFLFGVLFMLIFFKKKNIFKEELDTLYTIYFMFFIATNGFFFVNDLMLFFLNLELVNVIFYMFFLINLKSKLITLIKYKNLLSNFVWGSFFSLLFFFFNIIIFVYYCGSLSFNQILLNNSLIQYLL